MSKDRQWLSQVADRAGAGIVRWNIRQLRTHLHVLWAMTYPRHAVAQRTPPCPRAPTSSDTMPQPAEVLAPTPRQERLTGESSHRLGTSLDLGRPQRPGTEDPTVVVCLPIFLCAVDIIRKLIDKLPWERSSPRNVPVESEELHQFLQIVEEVSKCHNPTISAAIDTLFIRSIESAFSKMIGERDWRDQTSPLPASQGCHDILTNLGARHSGL